MNKLNEIPGEEGAGLALGITLPLLLVLGVSLGQFRQLASFKSGFSPVAPTGGARGLGGGAAGPCSTCASSGPIVRARSSRKTSAAKPRQNIGVKSWRSFLIMFTKT